VTCVSVKLVSPRIDITIDGDTAVAFTENVEQRFLAYGWNVLHVDHGDTDLAAISNAIEEAQKVTNKPTIIRLRTTIGFGSKQQGTHGVHGSGKLAYGRICWNTDVLSQH
jgi:transketolase